MCAIETSHLQSHRGAYVSRVRSNSSEIRCQRLCFRVSTTDYLFQFAIKVEERICFRQLPDGIFHSNLSVWKLNLIFDWDLFSCTQPRTTAPAKCTYWLHRTISKTLETRNVAQHSYEAWESFFLWQPEPPRRPYFFLYGFILRRVR